MDFTISEEDRLLQQSVRSFVEELANAVWKEIEKTAEIPQHLIDGMKELGLFGLSIPPEYGGLGFSVVQKALVHEMMGRGRGDWQVSSVSTPASVVSVSSVLLMPPRSKNICPRWQRASGLVRSR
jgi:alkylation response protein AidB-like acyl-CoA dehydrogenase